MIRLSNLLKETSQEAYVIHRFTGCGQSAAQNFIDDNKIDTAKLIKYLKPTDNQGMKNRYMVRDVISGSTDNNTKKKFIKLFKESVNENAYVDQAYKLGDTPQDNPYDDYDELDVEQEDMPEFINFLKSYQSSLDEANCSCVFEAEYQGREVKLGKPMQGDVKKFKVYVKNPKTGKIIKVNFGQKGMVIKKDNPERRKSFRARMHCDNPGPRTKANYWSCRKW